MSKKSCVIYDSWGTLLTNLPDDMAGSLVKMILRYAFDGQVVPTSDDAVNAMFKMIREKLDEDAEAYEETIRQRSEAGKRGMAKRWNNKTITEDNTVITDDNSVTEEITNITVSESVSDKEKKNKRFVAPSIDEVREYCEERQNNVDPDAFVNFYESKGWKVGSSAMKDWKAAVRTWEKRSDDRPANKSSPKNKIHSFSKERQMDYSAFEEFVNV